MSSARPKSDEQEVKEAEHDPKLDEGKTYGARTQSGISPLMRKRKADESDVAEETERSESGEEGEVKNKAEGMEGGIPKSTLRIPPSPSEKRKRKKQSSAEREINGAPVLKNTPPTTRVKKANLRISNEKEDDGDQTVEATTDNTEIHSSNGGSREKPSEEKEKCEEYEEDEEEKEETDKKPKQKGGKKKPAAATPKKPATPKPKRTKQPAKTKASKALALAAEGGVSIAPLDPAVGKRASEGGAQKSTAMTKAEMEILFDTVCEKVSWSGAASMLNARTSGAKHIASNLKRHWTTTLRKRVVDGYLD